MKIAAALALTAAAGVASAALTSAGPVPGFANYVFGPAPTGGGSSTVVAGDTVDAAVTGFGTGGGAFLSGPASHTVGAGPTILPSGGPGLIPDHIIDTSVSDAGGIRTLTIAIGAGGAALAPAGLAVGGAAIDTIFFEIPDLNGGPDLFNDPAKAGPATGTFDLLGTGGASLFSTAAGVTGETPAGDFSVGNGVGIDAGLDLFDPAVTGDILTGGLWVISYEIPAPATAGLLGLGGLVAIRRRR
ncbi:MAG: PEP-CTERM sorting domain-containing protein [Planctomycetota bacterium]